MANNIKTFLAPDWADYELLDTGEGEKLERFGKYKFSRPYADAVWPKTMSKKEWENVDGVFHASIGGSKAGWKMNSKIEKFVLSFDDIKFYALPTPFRHLSFFPEQASHWKFIEDKIKEARSAKGGQVKFLNLFGYTGVASLVALSAGANVTHLDASKQSLAWAKDNERLSNLDGLRIIEDDALKFLERESKRGNKYDAIIMDPPKFGRGPKGEVWKIEEMLPKLLNGVRKILSDKPLFVILTSYAIDSSSFSLGYALADTMKDFKGEVEAGELCILEKSNKRAIPSANTAVWSAFEK